MPKGAELFQLLLFLCLIFFALFRVEREERFLWFEEEGSLELRVLSPPQESEEGLRVKVEILGGDFPELRGKKALLLLYRSVDLPSKSFSMFAEVKAEGNRVYVKGSYRDIEDLISTKESIRDLYIKRVEEKFQDFQTRALILTYLFGEAREFLPQDLQYYFLRTGLLHLLVISGFHVGMVFLMLRFCLPYPYGLWLGAVGVSFYVLLLVPQEPPVLRAWLMLLLWVLIKLQEGRPNALTVLFFSASLLLLIEPSFVRSYSFWLSFFATLYILLGLRLLPPSDSLIYRYALLPTALSFFAFLGVSPLLLSFTNASMGGIIFSTPVGYLFFPFTLYGILQILTFFSLPTFPLEVTGKLILHVVSLLSHLDMELRTPLSTRTAYILSFCMALFLYVLGLLRKSSQHYRG
ncbi:MAG: ComEC/Rec2 family competence protein [Aquificaceae bacterium]|nr:ComEC/Rec2 family competence protein [Aquificaceae bacterium]MCX7990332.1 ComEC/Rec2 family competence protein [Aquificaceae bacterium]